MRRTLLIMATLLWSSTAFAQVDPQTLTALMLELARRNDAAEALGMGHPYGSMLSVLQGIQIQQRHEELIRQQQEIARQQRLQHEKLMRRLQQ